MSFAKKQIPQYPKRLWELAARPGVGKSTFAMRMRGPLLPIDADHRAEEVAYLNPDMLELSPNPADHNNPSRIAEILNANMPGAQVGTIIVDSLTAIIAPFVTAAIVAKEEGKIKNLYAGFKDKALAMRTLQDAVTRWGTDVLWIYHIDDARDADGKAHTKETISRTELARLMRSVNLRLELVVEEKTNKRGVKVKWARRGRSGMILWDETGTWLGMPERLEREVYDGLTKADMDTIEQTTPAAFVDDAAAIAWGLEQGAFTSLQHARNAYEKIMREHDGANLEPEDVAMLWTLDVQARKEALTVTNANEFWTRTNALQFDRTAAQEIVKTHTDGKATNWSAAFRDVYAKSGAGR